MAHGAPLTGASARCGARRLLHLRRDGFSLLSGGTRFPARLAAGLGTFRVLHKSPFFFGQSLELGGDLRSGRGLRHPSRSPSVRGVILGMTTPKVITSDNVLLSEVTDRYIFRTCAQSPSSF